MNDFKKYREWKDLDLEENEPNWIIYSGIVCLCIIGIYIVAYSLTAFWG